MSKKTKIMLVKVVGDEFNGNKYDTPALGGTEPDTNCFKLNYLCMTCEDKGLVLVIYLSQNVIKTWKWQLCQLEV